MKQGNKATEAKTMTTRPAMRRGNAKTKSTTSSSTTGRVGQKKKATKRSTTKRLDWIDFAMAMR